jgi:PIN domain nuclease of toxin-antitoxin system
VEAVTYLDTHVVAWLYAGNVELLSETARDVVNASELVISPMVMLELRYLNEIGRLRPDAREVIADLAGRIGLRVSNPALSAIIEAALQQGWTRDPFDRLIVAEATVEEAALLTRDEVIRQHYANAVW